jgi:hypothetical protein
MKLSRYTRRVAAGAAASAVCLSATFSLLAPPASAVTQDPAADPFIIAERNQIIALAARRAIPAIY